MSNVEMRADGPSEARLPEEGALPGSVPAADTAPEEGVYGGRFDASLPRSEAPPMDPGASRLAASLATAEPSPLTISPGARRHRALEIFFNRLVGDTGASPEGFNPNNPDFPDDTLIRSSWEDQVRDEFRLITDAAAFGSSMGDVSRETLRSLVGAQIDRIYPHASEAAHDEASDYVTRQLLEQRDHWQRVGRPEITPSWLQPPASEHRPDVDLPEIRASAPDEPSISPGAVEGAAHLADVAIAALDAAGVLEVGTAAAVGAGAATALPIVTVVAGLMELGLLDQEIEANEERVSEKEGVVLGMAEAIQHLDRDGSLPSLDELQTSSVGYLMNGPLQQHFGPSDPEAFRRGVEESFDLLNRLSPEDRLVFRDNLDRVQTEKLGHNPGTRVQDYASSMRFLLGLRGE